MPGHAAEPDQFEPERLDLGQHAVQRGLVRDRTSQERVRAPGLSAQARERAQHRGAQVAADTELAARRFAPVAPLAGHWFTSGLRGARVLAMLARANRHRVASRMENASTAGKSPMNPEATPTPTTGMIRPL